MLFEKEVRRGLLATALLCLTVTSILFWSVGFTTTQSITLSLVATLTICTSVFCYFLATTPEQQFTPFRISIDPNWYAIHQDVPLASDEKIKEVEEQWRGLRELLSKETYPPRMHLSVLRRGLTLVALGPNLWYSSESFFSNLEWWESIEELRPKREPLDVRYAPEFYVKRAFKDNLAFFEFGVVTEETRKRSHSFMPRDEINEPLAFLPEQLFYPNYHGEWDWKKRLQIYREALDILPKYGWEEDDFDDDIPIPNRPTTFKHKYFRVTFSSI